MPAPSIVATAGAANANSFASEAELDAHLDTRLNVGTYSTDNKKKALISATREISLLAFNGERTNGTQALSWPRQYCPNPDAPVIESAAGDIRADYDSTIVPGRVKNSTCELAFEYLRAGTSDPSALDKTATIKSETVGPISVEYAEPYTRPLGLGRFPLVMNYLRPLLSAATAGIELIRT